jgi:hypothetical protein
MNKVRQLLLSLACAGVLAIPTALSTPLAGHAYGNTALWQIAISGNCDNPSLCAGTFGTGGFWVWAEFDSGNTGNVTVTDCSHVVGGPTALQQTGGAQHVNINITGWTIAPGSAGSQTFIITSEVDTITGRTGGPPVVITIPSESFDTRIPAVAGHYSTNQILGFSAPGVSFQLQVVQL